MEPQPIKLLFLNNHIRLDTAGHRWCLGEFLSKDIRTAKAATKSKHAPESVDQGSRHMGLRSRSHAKGTPDGRYKCMECGFISSTLEEADAHHFRTHERQPPETYMNTPP